MLALRRSTLTCFAQITTPISMGALDALARLWINNASIVTVTIFASACATSITFPIGRTLDAFAKILVQHTVFAEGLIQRANVTSITHPWRFTASAHTPITIQVTFVLAISDRQ